MTPFSRHNFSQLIKQPWFSCGLEKEGLRVDRSGKLSRQQHFHALGSKLTHPFITTDFAEAQLELITPPCSSTKEMLSHLLQTHAFVHSHMGDELLWPGSMPGVLPRDDAITIANFGKSNIGQAKTIYRRGLSHRYGRSMQTVSGIHFNLSFTHSFFQQLAESCSQTFDQQFIDQQYFSLIRNYRRFSWIIHLLFGASPSFDNSFMHNSRLTKPSDYQALGFNTWLKPGATSLRMTDIGYMSKYQEFIQLCFDCLEDYTKSIRKALVIPIEEFSNIGVVDAQGEYQQLNANLLQIENEYYSQIRPKRNSANNSRPVIGLEQQGIEYIEIRNIDIDPFSPCGMRQESADFIILFLFWCLVENSPPSSGDECLRLQHNLTEISNKGRLQQTRIHSIEGKQAVEQALQPVFDSLESLAEMFQENGQTQYKDAFVYVRKTMEEHRLPSQSVEQLCQKSHQGLVAGYLSLAQQHRQTIGAPNAGTIEQYKQLAQTSHTEQTNIEIKDHEGPQSLQQFLEDYLRL